MKYASVVTLIVLIAFCQPQPQEDVAEQQWSSLWNGKDFTGWHSYLKTPYQLKVDSLGNPYEPFGIDHDPLEVFSIVPTDEGNAIRISGVAWGMIYTEKTYSNYHLKLKSKWGTAKHPPRENLPRDSGLLYHGFGEPGANSPWMSSQELQVQQGDMGDYWPVGDVEIDIPSVLHDSLYYIYKEGAPLRTYYLADILDTATHDSLAKRRVLKAFDAENAPTEWNDIELITYGDSSIHVVNGKVVMRLYNSRTMSDKSALKSGRIIIQSEGAEVFYKEFYLREIDKIPEEYREDPS